MAPTIEELGIDQLSKQDRLRQIGEIWESLAPLDELEIPESHREELDRRLAAAERIAGLHAGAIQPAADFGAPLPDDFWAGRL